MFDEDFLTRDDTERQVVTRKLGEDKFGTSPTHSQESLGSGSTDSQTSLLPISQESLDTDRLSCQSKLHTLEARSTKEKVN